MRFTILLLLAFIAACNNSTKEPAKNEFSKKERLKNIIEESIKSGMNDPSSYEFVSFEISDTLFAREYQNNFLDMYKEKWNNRDEVIQEVQADIDTYSNYDTEYFQNLVKSKKEYIVEVKNYDKKIDSLERVVNSIDPDSIKRVFAVFTVRGNNKFGAKVLADYRVWITGDGRIERLKD